MKLLRPLLATIACGCLTLNVFAQKAGQLGLQVGLNTGTVRYVTEQGHFGTLTTGYQTGVAAGLTSRLPLSKHWALAPGLRYLRTGFTTNETMSSTDSGSGIQSSNTYQNTYALSRIELPVDILYSFQSQKGIFLVAGVNVGVLLGGKRTSAISYASGNKAGEYTTEDDIKVADTYPLGTTAYYLQRWDAGIKGGIGYQYCHVMVQASYRVGLVNMAAKSALNFPSPSIYSRLVELQVAYLFNK